MALALSSIAPLPVRGLPVDQFAREAARPRSVIVDLRDRADVLASGFIPGAINIPLGVLQVRANWRSPASVPALGPSVPVLLYGAGPATSSHAARILRDLGFTDVAYLEASFTTWQESARPTVV